MLRIDKFSIQQVSYLPRSVQSGNWKEYEIEVITGYDALHDNYPIHIRIQNAGGPWEKLSPSIVATGSDEYTAFVKGWEIVNGWSNSL